MRFLDKQTYTVWCLSPASSNGVDVSKALAEAFGGHPLDLEELCLPQPDTVPLSELGYNLISGLHNEGKFTAYLARIAEHMGAEVVDGVGLAAFAKVYLDNKGPGFQYTDVVKDMYQSPWMKVSPYAACISNRNASSQDVEVAIAWGCQHLTGEWNCNHIDKGCQSDVFAKGDWVFSRYYRHAQTGSNSLEQCNFHGAAMFASPHVYRRVASSCILADDELSAKL
ncbi:TDP1 [Symbiodinium sp. CCMP2592]|nr:TDP1 [Symbiodinium sp. CCMP2592]